MVSAEEFEQKQRREYAAALKALRIERGMTLQQAADKLGISLQAWQNYEAAKRKFDRNRITTVTRALDATPEDLEIKRASLADEDLPARFEAPGLAEHKGRGFEIAMEVGSRFGPEGFELRASQHRESIDLSTFFGPDWRVLQLPGDEMAPYADPGGFVTYNVRKPPQPGKGCVIRLADGRYLVRKYEGMKDGRLEVTALHPSLKRENYALRDIEGVFPIGMRID